MTFAPTATPKGSTFRTSSRPWREALKAVQPAIYRRATKRVLECVRLAWADGFLSIEGTDLENAIRIRLPVETEGSGTACVPLAPLMASTCKGKAGKADVYTFTADGLRFGVSTPAGSLAIDGCDPNEYPEIPADPVAWTDTPGLGEAVTEARVFAGDMASRFVLNAVELRAGAVTATDGRRLYSRPVAGLGDVGIFSPRAFSDSIDGYAWARERIVCAFRGHGRAFGFVLFVRVMDGTYPDREQIIPRNVPQECRFDPADWLRAVETVRPFVSQEAGAVALRFEEGRVTFETAGSDGRAQAEARQDGMNHGFRIGFNADYVRDFLRLGADRFACKDENRATIFKAGDRSLVLMPIVLS